MLKSTVRLLNGSLKCGMHNYKPRIRFEIPVNLTPAACARFPVQFILDRADGAARTRFYCLQPACLQIWVSIPLVPFFFFPSALSFHSIWLSCLQEWMGRSSVSGKTSLPLRDENEHFTVLPNLTSVSKCATEAFRKKNDLSATFARIFQVRVASNHVCF